ncbi:unnamed protein product [Miscanthus lutarioriparius]|uniref:Uncharacterized protein n=1 Tax=Miscanthus lutarioriparius TaxID=422564 RepID=A0A811MBG9_9POAL|nr:unnamed protein product [Miscanthus lutarioriparius]
MVEAEATGGARKSVRALQSPQCPSPTSWSLMPTPQEGQEPAGRPPRECSQAAQVRVSSWCANRRKKRKCGECTTDWKRRLCTSNVLSTSMLWGSATSVPTWAPMPSGASLTLPSQADRPFGRHCCCDDRGEGGVW